MVSLGSLVLALVLAPSAQALQDCGGDSGPWCSGQHSQSAQAGDQNGGAARSDGQQVATVASQLVAAHAEARAEVIPADSYADYVFRICGGIKSVADAAISPACQEKYKAYGHFLKNWDEVCQAPSDSASPNFQDQQDAYERKCPKREAWPAAPIANAEAWNKIPQAQRHEVIQDLKDFREGFDRTANLYHVLMTGAINAKDLAHRMDDETVGIVPSFGQKQKPQLTVREAMFVYLGPDALNKLIGVPGLKGKPQAAQSGNSGATSRWGALEASHAKTSAQEKKADKDAKGMAKALEKLDPISAKLDDDEAAAYVADVGSANRFLMTRGEAVAEAKSIAAAEQVKQAKINVENAKKEEVDKPAAGINDVAAANFRAPSCGLFDFTCKGQQAKCAVGDFECTVKASLGFAGTAPQQTEQPSASPAKGQAAAKPARHRNGNGQGSASAVDMSLADARVNSWTVRGADPVTVSEYRSEGQLRRISFAHKADDQGGAYNGYESYVAVDSKHQLAAADANSWQVASGSALEVKPFGEQAKIWRLPAGHAAVNIPKSQALSDEELKKLGFVERGSALAAKKLIAVPESGGTEYKQSDNGDIMRVDWTPAGGQDGGSWVRVSGSGPNVKLEPTATSYLVKGPATILLKSPNAEVKSIAVPAGKTFEVDRNTKTAKEVQAPSVKPSPIVSQDNGWDIKPRCSGPDCIDSK